MRLPFLLFLAASTVAVSCRTPDRADATSIQVRLRALQERIKSIESGDASAEPDVSGESADAERLTPKDRMILQAATAFGTATSDAELRTVADLVLEPEYANLRWLAIRLLIDRRLYDDSARLVVSDTMTHPDEASYRLWKWLEFSYGDRSDYQDTAARLTDGLLRQFANGSSEVRLAVARLFGKTAAEAALGVEAFKANIGYER